MAVGKGEELVILNFGWMVIENVFDAVWLALSETRTTKANVPGAAGVPPIVPSVVSVKPGGSEPDDIVQT